MNIHYTLTLWTILISPLWATDCAVPEKKTHPPYGRSLEIPRGPGVLKVKILEAKYEAKLEFPEGWGYKTKNLPWGEYGYFLELCNIYCHDNEKIENTV